MSLLLSDAECSMLLLLFNGALSCFALSLLVFAFTLALLLLHLLFRESFDGGRECSTSLLLFDGALYFLLHRRSRFLLYFCSFAISFTFRKERRASVGVSAPNHRHPNRRRAHVCRLNLALPSAVRPTRAGLEVLIGW